MSSKNELRVWYSPDYIQLFAPTHRLSLLTTNGNDEQGTILLVASTWGCEALPPTHYKLQYLSIYISIYLSVCLSVCLCVCVCPSINLSIYHLVSYLAIIYLLSILSIYQSVYLSIYPPVRLSANCPSVCLFGTCPCVRMSVCHLSIWPYVCLSIFQSVYLSVCLSIHSSDCQMNRFFTLTFTHSA